MRCLVFTNHFEPEQFRVNDIVAHLTAQGHYVKVITCIPDYPQGRFYKGYSYFNRRCETVFGAEVVRAAVIPRGGGGAVRLALNYLSAIISFFFQSLWQGIFYRWDMVFVHDTSPAFVCLGACRVSRMQKIPLYHWLLDIWPESLAAAGIHNKRLYGIIERMMAKIYATDTRILIGSRGFAGLLRSRGVAEDKLVWLPNWGDAGLSLSEGELPPLPDGFIVMFAGNLGRAQNLENVLEAAKLCSDCRELHWVFVGDGRMKPWIEDFVKNNKLEDTVHLPGRFPIQMMSVFFARADLMLVSLNDETIFNLTLPAKVQAYMASSKPIVGFLAGEGADIITDAGCGWTVDPGNPEDFARLVKELSQAPAQTLAEAGKKGRDYYERHFTMSRCMEILDRTIFESCGETI
ncbi:MAG: glycosyltransferase family 4 protein [Bacteroidales bacterium]|nr:glycosyltransferase family 4 protein [Bacteroidales bacterium]